MYLNEYKSIETHWVALCVIALITLKLSIFQKKLKNSQLKNKQTEKAKQNTTATTITDIRNDKNNTDQIF